MACSLCQWTISGYNAWRSRDSGMLEGERGREGERDEVMRLYIEAHNHAKYIKLCRY